MTKNKLSNQQKRRIDQNIKRHLNDDNLPKKLGLVISHNNEMLEVESLDSGEVIRCFQKRNLGSIVTGDYVSYCIDLATSPIGLIHAINQRQNLLERPSPFGKNKALAANIDQVIIVIATEPEPIGHYIDRYLIAAHSQNLKPIIILNKTDLETPSNTQQLYQRYQQLNYPSILSSALDNSKLQPVKDILKNKVSIFVGQSGVGKSALLNALFDKPLAKVGEISTMNKRGKHTTTSARLYHLPTGGSLIDSPGIREFGIWHLSKDDILNGFIEFHPFIGHCKFRNCNHEEKTPGCAIVQALNDHKIDNQRFINYHRLMNELNEN